MWFREACQWWLMGPDAVRSSLIPASWWLEDRLQQNNELFSISCSPGRKPRDEIKMMWVIEIKEWTVSKEQSLWESLFFLNPRLQKETHKFLTCGETRHGRAAFVRPDLLVFGSSSRGCQYHSGFNSVRALFALMLRYCQRAPIWKLIQHCVHSFWSPVSATWLLCFTWHPKSRQEQRELH